MKIINIIIFTFIVLTIFVFVGSVYSDEIIINGNRVIIKNKDGQIIDTANLPKGQTIKDGENVEISDRGVSIGSVTNNGGEQKNINRRTNLDNVTIINNNGEKTIYKKPGKNSLK